MKGSTAYLVRLALLAALVALTISSPSVAATAPQSSFLGRITQGVRSPVRLASDQFGNIFIADPRAGGILKYGVTGDLITRFPVKGARGLAITPGGDLVVSRGDSASVLDSTTGFEKFKLGAGAGQFRVAAGVATDESGQIYVTDSLDNCVQIFNASGAPVPMPQAAPGKPANSFGSAGSLPGQFSLPTGIAYEKLSGQLAVVDTLNGRVQFFSKSGVFQNAIGTSGGGPLKFSSPRAIAFEYSKGATPALLRAYVVDSFQSQVLVIDPAGSGSYLSSIGSYGLHPGQLAQPVDLLFDQAESRLLVANGVGDVTLFGINAATAQTPDVTPPQLTLDQVPATVSSGTVLLTGTVEAEATVAIVAGNGAVAGAVATAPRSPALNFWSATVSGLTPGDNQITVIARDQQQSATGLSVVVTYNPGGVKLSIDPVNSPTNKGTQTLSGTMETGAGITLSANTPVTFGPVSFPSATTWQAAVSGLVAGDNVITATGSAPGRSAAVATVISLVTTPPDLNVSTLLSGEVSAAPLLNVSGSVPNNGILDRVTVNGQVVPVANDSFSTAVVLVPGDNTVTVQAFDKAGNVATDSRTINLNRQRPAVTISAPADGSTTNSPLLSLSGNAPPQSTVTLLLQNGSAAGATFFDLSQPGDGTAWSTHQPLPLEPGLNTIIASVIDTSGAASQAKVTVNYDAKAPPLALGNPASDRPVNTAALTLGGTSAPGVEISAAIDGAPVSVTANSDGSFTIPVKLSTEGVHAVAVTATDALGNAVTSVRSFNLDLTAPVVTAISAQPVRVRTTDGILTARDKNGAVAGAVVTVNPDGSSTIDLSNATFDAATLNIEALDAAGNSSRSGDLDGSGKVDVLDALLALRLALGMETPSFEKLLRGDVAPRPNGAPAPDGSIDIRDVVYIMEKAVGLH